MMDAILTGAQSLTGQGLDLPITLLAVATILVGVPLFGAGVYWATSDERMFERGGHRRA